LVRAPEERLGVKPRDVAEVLRLLTPELADMVRLQWRTGMRSGELVQLAWPDIDTSRDIWLFRPKRWKGSGRVGARRRPRIIALGARCQKILAKYGDRQGAIFSPATSEAQRLAAMHKARTTPKSCGNRPGTNRKERPQKKPGTQWDAGSYGKAVRKAIKRAFDDGRISEKWTPHQLRHSAGERVRAKFGLDSASAYLGHKDVETTKIYAELDVQKAVEVAEALG
jgi:integrase